MLARHRSAAAPFAARSRGHTSAWLRTFCAIALAGCALLGAGCDEDEDLPGERGDLGEGNFVYRCLGENDSACTSGSPVLPQVMAIGSRFDMSFAVASGPSPTVISPASDIVRRDNGAFEVLQGGLFALLAVTGNSEVIDIKHLAAAPIAEVRVQRDNDLPVTKLKLAPGESATLRAVAFDALGVTLGGALTYAWHSSDEALVSVESLPQLNKVRIAAQGVGSATLMVIVGGKSFAVTVETGARLDASTDELSRDGGVRDAGSDAGTRDALVASPNDAITDASTADASMSDAGTADASTADAAGGAP